MAPFLLLMLQQPSSSPRLHLDFDQTSDGIGTFNIHVAFADDELADAFQREFGGFDV